MSGVGSEVCEWHYEIGEWMGIFNVVIGNLGAAKSSEVGAGVKRFPNIFGKGANIGARAAMDANFEFWVRIVYNTDGVNFDRARGDVKICAFASELVGTLAIDFDGRIFGWSLSDFPEEAFKGGVNIVEVRMRLIVFVVRYGFVRLACFSRIVLRLCLKVLWPCLSGELLNFSLGIPSSGGVAEL